jgi:hypothetical protein
VASWPSGCPHFWSSTTKPRRFARADPEGVKAIYSRADDVLLANPFGPAVVGWDAVGPGLEFASSRLQDGDVSRFEVLARYESGDTVWGCPALTDKADGLVRLPS